MNGSLASQLFEWAQDAGVPNGKNLESSYNLGKMPSETKDTGCKNIENAKSTTQLLELNTFKEYRTAFKETSDYKKLVESKAYKDSKDKDTLIHNAFLAYARAIEKDKLLYFSLALNQAPIIIKAPNDNKEQKRFLGYEWSNRKGDEGLKELHSPYLSPLFERDNPHNPNKLAHLIRQAFLESSSLQDETPSPSLRESEATEAIHNQQADSSVDCHEFDKSNSRNDKITIPQVLSPYACKARLIDMLDFSKVDFNKAISLNPTNSQGESNPQNPFENCTYKLVKLGEVVIEIINGSTPLKSIREYWNSNDIHWLTTPDFKENIFIESTSQFVSKKALQDKKVKIVPKESVLLTCTATIGKCAINKIELTTNQQINALICDNSKIINHYLVYILRLSKQTLENSATNPIVKHINLATLKNLKIPLPPLEIQKQIVSECEKVEEQYNTIKMSIEKYQELIKAILVKCGIIANNDEFAGGN